MKRKKNVTLVNKLNFKIGTCNHYVLVNIKNLNQRKYIAYCPKITARVIERANIQQARFRIIYKKFKLKKKIKNLNPSTIIEHLQSEILLKKM